MLDAAARRIFLKLLADDVADAVLEMHEWAYDGPQGWRRAICAWRGWVWVPCPYCNDNGYIAQPFDHLGEDGEYLGTEEAQYPCPLCTTGELAAAGVFPNGGRR
jgi:hypothetical protein